MNEANEGDEISIDLPLSFSSRFSKEQQQRKPKKKQTVQSTQRNAQEKPTLRDSSFAYAKFPIGHLEDNDRNDGRGDGIHGDDNDKDEENVFVPLRKKQKRKSTGKEDNLVSSYYVPQQSALMRSPQQAQQIRDDFDIQIEGDDIPLLITQFHEAGLGGDILYLLHSWGFQQPTPIQMQALPVILSGRDMIGNAETGSGKTLAYALPMLMMLRRYSPAMPGQGPLGLILAPSRELVEQIYEEVVKFIPQTLSGMLTTNPGEAHYTSSSWIEHHDDHNRNPWANATYPAQTATLHPSYQYAQAQVNYKVLGICGGVPVQSQAAPLKRGVDVLVATPGRLIDLIERKIVSLDRVSYLVMDEADRMLSLGLEEQLRTIVGLANARGRQTLLWSATMPKELDRLARSAVLNPIIVRVGQVGHAAPTIHQNVVFVHHYQKKETLLETLRQIPAPPVLIFCNAIHTVDYLVNLLRKEQFHVAGLHSNKTQAYRFRLTRAFREGGVDILVATDLASRGLDFTDVSYVVNYDIPDDIDDYVHRIGRTGRAGREGFSTSLLTLDCKIAKELKKLLQESKQPIPFELHDTMQFGHAVIQTELGDRIRY